MTFEEFSQINRERCESPNGFNHKLSSWSLSDWFTAAMGELGEAANLAKKLNRVRDGIPGNDETPEVLKEKLGRELADTFIYLDLLAQAAGVQLSEVVPTVFDAKSEKIGYALRLGYRGYIGDGLDANGVPLTGIALARDLEDGRSR